MMWLGIGLVLGGIIIFSIIACVGLDSENSGLVMCPTVMIALGVIIIGVGVENKYKAEAIANGYAEYVITNPETGHREWKWKCDIKKEER